MQRGEKLTVICYDVTSNRIRSRIAAHLEDHAMRVQDSVFEAWLDEAQVQALGERLSLMLEEGDSLRMYVVPRASLRNCIIHDALPLSEPHGSWFV